jgi:hypothetical protein
MVTTTSLDPTLNFRIKELRDSDLPEDHELARLALSELRELVLKIVVLKIVPVLAYVDESFRDKRVVEVAKNHLGNTLYLSRDGRWFQHCGQSGQLNELNDAVEYFVFVEILQGLEKAFNKALDRKRQHMHAIEKRTDLLGRIGVIVRELQ